MTAAELGHALRECAAEREQRERVSAELVGREPRPLFTAKWRSWRDEMRAAYAAEHAAFTRGNELLARFLGGKPSRRPFAASWGRSERMTRLLRRAVLVVPRPDPLREMGVRLDHYAFIRKRWRPLAVVSQPYGQQHVTVRCGEGRTVARQLAVPSWWNPAARVFVIMLDDAPEWERLEPLFAREGRS